MKNITLNITKRQLRTLLKWLGLFSVSVVIYILAANSALMQSQPAQETIELFGLIGASKDRSIASVAGVREQEIKINLDNQNFLAVKKIRFPLLDGKIYESIRNESEGFTRFADNEFTWRGKIFGDQDWSGDVTLTVKDKALSGLIYSSGAVYEIIPQENFKHILVEIDQSRLPHCGGGISNDDSEIINAENTNLRETPSIFDPSPKELFDELKISSSERNSSQNSLMVDNGSTIDVLIVYTAAVRSALGGTTQTEAFAQQAIASTNTVYLNSQITTRLRLVQTMEVSYADNGTGSNGLSWVRNDATVANARNSSKADLVALITENANDVCGIGYLMSSLSSSFQVNGFSLSQRSCAISGLTFAHELGHNQGADHNPENGTGGAHVFPYAYGHWDATANFRTVMSYTNPCPSCLRIPYFSNPLLTYSGVSLGITNQRDNARVINNTALTVSQFRDSGGGGGACPSATISPGQTINGTLSTSDCVLSGTNRHVDVYTFNGTAGQMISVSMNSTAFDTYLYLRDSSNQNIAEDDDGGDGNNSRIPADSGFFTLPAAGSYSIYATSFSDNATGSYSLNLAVNNTCTTSAINFGQTVNGNLSTSDCNNAGKYYDEYTFTGTSGQQIAISQSSTAFDSYLYLLNSSNQTITEDDDGGGGANSRIPANSGFFTLPASGTYKIRVSSFTTSATGAYTLILTTNSCSSATINFSQTINGSLSTSDCANAGKYYDAYTFSGTAGQQIIVSQNSTAFDTYLYLLNSGGQVIAENDDGGGGTNSRIPDGSGNFTLPANGTYTIRASAFTAGATGAYSINLTPGSGGNLQFGSPTFTVNENAGTATITVSRTGNSSGAVSINYATGNGTANAGQDYSSVSGTLNFANGVTSQSFNVSIINDSVVEGNETINLTLSNPTGGSVIGTPGTAILNIVDNDICTYSVTQTGVTIPEIPATGGTRSFNVTAPGGCTWSAFSNVLWIIVASGGSGSGNGTVTLNFALNTGDLRFGGVIIAGQAFNFLQQGGSPPQSKKPFDFDGDGKTDYGVFRPSNSGWYLQNSNSGFFGLQFGISTDKITPADYDGDGRTDIAVFRNGNWYLQRSQLGFTAVQFGQTGDIPVPADYDGDGKADIAVFRPSNGSWYLLMSRQGFAGVQFGQNGDKPVPADYDGDGRADIAVYRPSNGAWYLLQSSQGFAGIGFGIASDIPIPADYDGDGKADIAVFRSGNWYLLRSQLGFAAVPFGVAEDKPVVGDYDGDGKADIAVWRPSAGAFYVLRSQIGYTGFGFGQNGDIPVASAFIQ